MSVITQLPNHPTTKPLTNLRTTPQEPRPFRHTPYRLNTLFDAKTPQDIAALSPEERRALLAQLLREKASQQSSEKPKSYPLSFAQQRLWFLDRLQSDEGAYNVSRAFWLTGQLNVEALRTALKDIIGRHQSLRTTFGEDEDGRPVQIISPDSDPALTAVDLRPFPDPRTEALVRLTRESVRPFDLQSGPLFRPYLWRTADEEHLFLLVMHHIISDAWSLSVFYKELSILYAQEQDGRTGILPPLATQYTDFAHQQRERLQGAGLERHLAFWRPYLAGRPAWLELPADHARPPVQRFNGRNHHLKLSQNLSEALKALSRKQKTTPFTTLMAAFNLLLARYTGSSDILIGTPTANRNETGIQPLIGFFVNILPVRTDLSGNPTFIELLQRVHNSLTGILAHQELPFERLVEEIQPERELSRHPIFQVVFAMQNVPDEQLVLTDLTVTTQNIPAQRSRFDLTLFLDETAAGYHGSIEYSTDLFEPETIARLAGHFETLLADIVAHPNSRVSELTILTEGERRQLLVEWNQTNAAFSSQRLVHQLVEEQADRQPEAAAVVAYKTTADIAAELTYEQLNRRANQLAHYLRRLGVGPEVPVGVCMHRSAENVVALLAVLKAGGAYLPLDPVYPRERLAFMLQDAGQLTRTAEPILLTQPRLREQIPVEGVRHIYLDSNWATIAAEPAENLDTLVSAENLAYIIYTSGTTGRPKGIQLEHRTLLNLIYWHQRAFEVTAEDQATHLAGPAFDASVWELWPYLAAGAAVHIPDEETRLLPWQMRDWLISRKITLSFLPTPLAEAIIALDWPEQAPLRKILTGGDKLSHFPPPGLPFELVNNYGPTENTVVTTYGRVPAVGETAEMPAIGRPIENVQVYITDKFLNPVPVGVPGELLVGGESLARGYLNRPDLTAAAFIPDPFHPQAGRRLYRTGDLVKYLPDGRIAFLGRIDQQVKIRGFRIELSEIETVLQQHPAVAEAIVLAREDTPGEKRLAGYVISRKGAAIEPEALRRFLGERLPGYMVPALFVSLSEWPLTPNGKIDHQALPVPDWGAAGQGRTLTAPRTPEEEKLAAIWREVLGLAQVGVHDNFFELGGDSILSIQILARANQAGLQLTTRQLFQHQTIAALAASATPGRGPGVAAEQGRPVGAVPLTPIQQWFFEQDLADRHHWNMAVVLETRPPLSPAALAQTFRLLQDHHDALRLRFVEKKGAWEQFYVNDNADQEIFSYVNLGDSSRKKQRAVYERTADQTQTSLNLTDGPLIRAVYFDYGAGEKGRLLIVVHHLVMDGVSWRVLLEDLHNVYTQISEGRPIQLPPKTVSFQQWSKALAALAETAAITAELDYWLALPWQTVQPLPLDYAEEGRGVNNTVGSAETIATMLDQKDTQTLLQAVPAAYGAQINDILLTALAQTLAEWNGSPVALIDLEGHGREELGEAALDLSRTVGWFTAMYPVLPAVEPGAATAETVTTIQEQLAQVPNKGVGYGLLRYLWPDSEAAERLRELPQAEVSFNYLGQFDRLLPPDSPFQLSHEPAGATRSPQSQRKHLLNINAQVRDGRLEIGWTYSRNHHQKETIVRLAGRYQRNLQRLIGERPINGISQPVYREIERAMTGRGVETIVPLAPGQAAMVAHTAQNPGSAAYFLQWVYEIEGALDTAAFRQAWETAVTRHEILRTVFAAAENGAHYQVVLQQAGLDWQELDWQALAENDRREKLAALLAADRKRGFRPSMEPPVHWIVVRYGPEDYRLVWSHHHALLDGWSMAPLWQEILAAYEALRQGQAVNLRPPVPYRRYLEWVRRQPLFEAGAYWQKQLAGVRNATNLPATARPPYKWVETRLSEEETAAVQAFARQNKLTMNTVVQGAWARVLAQHNGRADVVFGVTTAGRPSAVPGVEQIVGLMLNTLPLRVRVEDELADREREVQWLRKIQEQQAVQNRYEHISLAQVQTWSGMSAGQPLFESFLRFQNYPLKQFLDSWQGSLTIRDSQVFDQWHYPLSVVVVPGEETVLRIGYDGGVFSAEEVGRLAADFQHFIK